MLLLLDPHVPLPGVTKPWPSWWWGPGVALGEDGDNVVMWGSGDGLWDHPTVSGRFGGPYVQCLYKECGRALIRSQTLYPVELRAQARPKG